MRAIRTEIAATMALVVIAAVALSLTGCMCAVDTMISGPSSMRPGQTAVFTVMEQGQTGAQTRIEPAGGTWAWNSQGPAAASYANNGGGVLTWTAPSTPGKYTVFAVGRGGTDNTRAESGRARREVRIVVTVGDAAPPEEQSSERPPVAPTGPTVKILDVGNGFGIRKGGSAPSFMIDKPVYVTDITTYHFLDGGGPTPGTLGLQGADGKTYGPWPCKGADGQGGVKNAFWVANPNEVLPAGTYTIVDSDPGTWSTNDKAGGVGFTTVNVIYTK